MTGVVHVWWISVYPKPGNNVFPYLFYFMIWKRCLYYLFLFFLRYFYQTPLQLQGLIWHLGQFMLSFKNVIFPWKFENIIRNQQPNPSLQHNACKLLSSTIMWNKYLTILSNLERFYFFNSLSPEISASPSQASSKKLSAYIIDNY